MYFIRVLLLTLLTVGSVAYADDVRMRIQQDGNPLGSATTLNCITPSTCTIPSAGIANITGAGGGGGSQSLQQTVDIGRSVTNAVDVASAVRIGGTVNYFLLYGNNTEGAVLSANPAQDLNWTLASGFGLNIKDNTGAVITSFTNNTKTMAIGSTAIVNFGSALRTAPAKIGTSLPGTCTVGDQFFKSDASAGSNMYGCTASNTWTAQGGGGSGSPAGSPTQLQYNNAGAFGGLSTLTTDGTNLTLTGLMTNAKNSIGSTTTDALVLANTTPAGVGAQQWSPRLRFVGQGWKTTATAASQQVEWYSEVQPVQSTTSPGSLFAFTPVINGTAGYSIRLCGYSTIASILQLDGGAIACGAGNFGTGLGTVNAANLFGLFTNSTERIVWGANGQTLKSDYFLGWAASTLSNSDTADTAHRRFGAGIVAFDNGTAIGTTVGNARHILAARHQIAEITTLPTAADLTIGGSNAEDTAHLIMTNDKICFAYNRSGTVNYLCAALDGTATTWTNNSTAP